MRFETAPPFEADLRRLSRTELEVFRRVVLEEFAPACDAFLARRPFPRRLRVKSIKGAPGVFEMTWSFAGPDGRATWEWVRLPDGSPCVRWRRVGGHAIFGSP